MNKPRTAPFDGVNGHLISMQGKSGRSLAVCECGWKNEVRWGEFQAQDNAVHGHWATVLLEAIVNGPDDRMPIDNAKAFLNHLKEK